MDGSHAHIFVTYRYLITCFSNDTSLLAVIRPYKKSAYNRAHENQLQKATGQNYACVLLRRRNNLRTGRISLGSGKYEK